MCLKISTSPCVPVVGLARISVIASPFKVMVEASKVPVTVAPVTFKLSAVMLPERSKVVPSNDRLSLRENYPASSI